MKITPFTLEGACAEIQTHQDRFPFMMATCLSEVRLGKAVFPVDLSEVIEARYFGPECEMRFYDDGNGLNAALVQEEPKEVFIDRTSKLLPAFGKTLTRRQYVVYDEDGQGDIKMVRLLKWEGGQDDG